MLQVRENLISLRKWCGDIAHLRTWEGTLKLKTLTFIWHYIFRILQVSIILHILFFMPSIRYDSMVMLKTNLV